MIEELTDDPKYFPPIEKAENGYIAYGGDLSAERLTEAYTRGIFPYFAFRFEKILWACPQDRFVIFPQEIHISHSMRNARNRDEFEVTFNEEFDGVIESCAVADGRYEEDFAWLGGQMIEAYKQMHKLGRAMSVEVWKDDILAGGLYGVTLNKCFFGESMFSNSPNASKMALIELAEHMNANGWKMIDCQYETQHLKSMGGHHITYKEYLEIVNK